jgi:hypothetical protein
MKHRLHAILILILLVLTTTHLVAQESDKKKSSDFWHRVSVGGNLGFQFGTVTGITLSPEVSIRIIDQLYGGLGFNYQYLKYKNYYVNVDTSSPDFNQYIDYESSVYGGKIFFRYYLRSLLDNFLGNVFAHVEYEYLTYTRPFTSDPHGTIWDPYYNLLYRPGNERVEINSVFVGGGYSQPIAGRAFLDILILFNLNDSYDSPYSNPIFRIGFGVGL